MIIAGTKYTIQQIDESHMDEILLVYKQCEDFLALGPVPLASRRMVADDLNSSRELGGVFCGIFIDGLMVGVVDFIPCGFEACPECAYLSLLMIAEPNRRKGIGRDVISAIEDEIGKNKSVTEIRAGVQVNNKPAIAFWERMGYKIVGGPEEMPDMTVVYHLNKELRREPSENSRTDDHSVGKIVSLDEEKTDSVSPDRLHLIGTLGEKTLHSEFKRYIDPDTSHHEVKVGRYYADIMNDDGITEIQTRQFNKLRAKLDAFLSNYPVTVVYPVAYHKWLLWVDEETGEVTNRRLSPRRGTACDIFPELYRIKSSLTNENLRIRIIFADVEEYRLLNGWSRDRKKGSWRKDRIPVSIHSEVVISSRGDYLKLIPENLAEPFTSKDFSKAAHISLKNAQTALNILNDIGAVCRVGKISNAFTYVRHAEP